MEPNGLVQMALRNFKIAKNNVRSGGQAHEIGIARIIL
jgi:hypothetical protein